MVLAPRTWNSKNTGLHLFFWIQLAATSLLTTIALVKTLKTTKMPFLATWELPKWFFATRTLWMDALKITKSCHAPVCRQPRSRGSWFPILVARSCSCTSFRWDLEQNKGQLVARLKKWADGRTRSKSNKFQVFKFRWRDPDVQLQRNIILQKVTPVKSTRPSDSSV